jgi:hypothetical protein
MRIGGIVLEEQLGFKLGEDVADVIRSLAVQRHKAEGTKFLAEASGNCNPPKNGSTICVRCH